MLRYSSVTAVGLGAFLCILRPPASRTHTIRHETFRGLVHFSTGTAIKFVPPVAQGKAILPKLRAVCCCTRARGGAHRKHDSTKNHLPITSEPLFGRTHSCCANGRTSITQPRRLIPAGHSSFRRRFLRDILVLQACALFACALSAMMPTHRGYVPFQPFSCEHAYRSNVPCDHYPNGHCRLCNSHSTTSARF